MQTAGQREIFMRLLSPTWVEVQAHDARLRGVRKLGVRGVLQAVDVHQPGCLLQEIVRAVAHGKEVVVRGVPAQRGNLPSTGLVAPKLPQRQQAALSWPACVRC